MCCTALCSSASSTGSRPPHAFGFRITEFTFLGRTRLSAFFDPGRVRCVVQSLDFCTGLCHKDPDLWLKEGTCPTSSIGAGRWRRSRGTVVIQQNLRQQTRKARRVPPVKKEGPGEGHVKQEEPFEGKRGQRATSIGRGAIPAMRTGTPDRARPTQAPPPDRGGSGARQDPPRPLHHSRYPGK